MSLLPPHIKETIDELSKLPGIGPKSAERLTFHLLRSSKASPEKLGEALKKLKTDLGYCSVCQMVVAGEKQCAICKDKGRDHSVILVVEEPLEVIAFEKSGFKGVYHVLHGVLSPIDGMGPEQLKLKELIDRCQGSVNEVIIATNLDVEGEATASFIKEKLKGLVPTITRLAHGLPRGADIEFADQITLREAVAGRRRA